MHLDHVPEIIKDNIRKCVKFSWGDGSLSKRAYHPSVRTRGKTHMVVYIHNPSTPTEGWEVGNGESPALRPVSLLHTVEKQQRNPVSNKLEGEDQSMRLSSDLHACCGASIRTYSHIQIHIY